jgi:hypothetical protein
MTWGGGRAHFLLLSFSFFCSIKMESRNREAGTWGGGWFDHGIFADVVVTLLSDFFQHFRGLWLLVLVLGVMAFLVRLLSLVFSISAHVVFCLFFIAWVDI